MPTSLYDLTIPAYLQTMGAVSQVMKVGAAHFAEAGINTANIDTTRLHPTMLPFQFQIWSVCHLPVDSVEGLRTGVFDPSLDWPQLDYAALQQALADRIAVLQAVTPDEINACAGKEISFTFEGRTMRFVAEDFVHSFLLPNLYFHATTAYDILRINGAPLEKRHYLGRVRMLG